MSIKVEDNDLKELYQMYSISNTPLFFLRKLRESPVTGEMSRRFKADEIFDSLKESLQSNASDAADYILPYVYLTALAQTREPRLLNEVKSVEGLEKRDWLPYLWRVLLETSPSVNSSTIDASAFEVQSFTPKLSGACSNATFEKLEFIGAK